MFFLRLCLWIVMGAVILFVIFSFLNRKLKESAQKLAKKHRENIVGDIIKSLGLENSEYLFQEVEDVCFNKKGFFSDKRLQDIYRIECKYSKENNGKYLRTVLIYQGPSDNAMKILKTSETISWEYLPDDIRNKMIAERKNEIIFLLYSSKSEGTGELKMGSFKEITTIRSTFEDKLTNSKNLREKNSFDSGINSENTDNESKDRKGHSSFIARKAKFEKSKFIASAYVLKQLAVLKSRIEYHDLVYSQWGLAEFDPCGQHIAFNFYGPPGTGKTMCVEAIADELGKKIIDVSYAEIESKYVGETGKNIVTAFRAAKEQDAILFFDEADSILGNRMTSVTQAADQAVNVSRAVMLKQLDAFDGIVAFATNLAKNYDKAFVRRIPVHIEIPLPDLICREKIAQQLLTEKIPFYKEIDCKKIAEWTDGMSGGDIKNVVVNSICALADKWETTNCTDKMQIFYEQVDSVKKAKENVGEPPVTITRKKVPLKDGLPLEDINANFEG